MQIGIIQQTPTTAATQASVQPIGMRQVIPNGAPLTAAPLHQAVQQIPMLPGTSQQMYLIYFLLNYIF
jgi:hypothetical protein